MQLNPDTLLSVFLLFLLILPGFLAQGIIHSLVKRSSISNTSEITYRSILHSLAIYIIIYPVTVLFCGVDVQKLESVKMLVLSNRWAPMLTVLIIGAISFVWALFYVYILKTSIVSKIQKTFGLTVDPPNIYARILDPVYQRNDNENSYWITLEVGDKLLEGGVEYQVTNGNVREVYLTNVAFLDPITRQIIFNLPPGTGVIVDLDKRSITEITITNN